MGLLYIFLSTAKTAKLFFIGASVAKAFPLLTARKE